MNVDKENCSNNDNDILDKEIKSWSGFEYALRQENALLFNKMLSEAREYTKAVTAKGEPYQAESLFMALILHQQRMINQLIDKISKERVHQKEQEGQQITSKLLKEYD